MIFHELGLQLHSLALSYLHYVQNITQLSLNSFANYLQLPFCRISAMEGKSEYVSLVVVKELFETQDRSYRTTLHIFGEDMKEEL